MKCLLAILSVVCVCRAQFPQQPTNAYQYPTPQQYPQQFPTQQQPVQYPQQYPQPTLYGQQRPPQMPQQMPQMPGMTGGMTGGKMDGKMSGMGCLMCAKCKGAPNDPKCGMREIPVQMRSQVGWAKCKTACFFVATANKVERGCMDDWEDMMMGPMVLPPKGMGSCSSKPGVSKCFCRDNGCNSYSFGAVSKLEWMDWGMDAQDQVKLGQVCSKNPCKNQGQCGPNPAFLQYAAQLRQFAQRMDTPGMTKEQMMQMYKQKPKTVLPFTCRCSANFTGPDCSKRIWKDDMMAKMPQMPQMPQMPGAMPTMQQIPTQYQQPRLPTQYQQQIPQQQPTTQQLPNAAQICANNPCRNGASCIANTSGTPAAPGYPVLPFRCLCPPGFTGLACETRG